MSGSAAAALIRLGASVAEAACEALSTSRTGPARAAEPRALLDYDAVAAHVTPGTVVADASSTDGLAGRSLLLLSPEAARRFVAGPDADDDAAAAETAGVAEDGEAAGDAVEAVDADAEPEQGDQDPTAAVPAAEAPSLNDGELGRIRIAADRVNAAVASTLSLLLAQAIQYEPAEVSVVDDPRFVVRPGPVQALCATITVAGAELRLIQFAPNALVMRASRAFEELSDEDHPLGEHGPSAQTLSEIDLRVWAELGRTELGLSEALALPPGAVVELDRDADSPVDLFVNGVSFGRGRLIVTDEGEWALALDEVGPATRSPAAPPTA